MNSSDIFRKFEWNLQLDLFCVHTRQISERMTLEVYGFSAAPVSHIVNMQLLQVSCFRHWVETFDCSGSYTSHLHQHSTATHSKARQDPNSYNLMSCEWKIKWYRWVFTNRCIQLWWLKSRFMYWRLIVQSNVRGRLRAFHKFKSRTSRIQYKTYTLHKHTIIIRKLVPLVLLS